LKPARVFLSAWILTGIGAVLGSILGNGLGKRGLFVGAIVGGVVGVALSVVVGSRLQWLAREDRAGGLVGGIIGFAIAAPIAVTNLHTPITPVLVCALAGVGVLLGAGIARGWRQNSESR
jgi:hypothetical protein